jgi:hypothetical protein
MNFPYIAVFRDPNYIVRAAWARTDADIERMLDSIEYGPNNVLLGTQSLSYEPANLKAAIALAIQEFGRPARREVIYEM